MAKPHRIPTEGLKLGVFAAAEEGEDAGLNPTESRPRD